ncbi:phospholipase B-like 1 isoform X1 [Asterias amurensis]|uniref:phospholipase B-like 1 isoform X1 n=1 Tax=Asterias amurensis TaxID=7602 RepID=UPI003AB40A43
MSIFRSFFVVCFAMMMVQLLPTVQGVRTTATVYYNGGKFSYKVGVLDKSGVAYGAFNDTTDTTGWGVLDVKFGPTASYQEDLIRMKAAGMLEGILTSECIYQSYVNMAKFLIESQSAEFKTKLSSFLKEQDKWTRQMIDKKQSDPFWQGVGLILAQFDGLVAGYNLVPYQNKSLDLLALSFLNNLGDVLDLQHALNPSSFPNSEKDDPKSESKNRFYGLNNHCSALIKALPGFEDVLMSHSSWFTYSAMLRIYKHYSFDLSFSYAAAKRMSFSSYPGMLESLDDFYLLSSSMVMLQTTNNIFNQTLYDLVTPYTLPAWVRVRVANLMANNGSQWGQIVGRYNSGTYNNQYMVIDKKRISGEFLDGTLTVVEQIPGLVKTGDQTAILRAGYWPSYNVPFYEEIYTLSGYPAMKAKKGNLYSYQLTPRAEIFRRDNGNVKDMDSLMNVMRYNDYLHDPYSEKNPAFTICSRYDLEPSAPFAGGCTDTKATNLGMSETMSALAINGPTTSHGLPIFKWTKEFNISHIGLPESYNFDVVLMKPSL